MMQHRPMMGVNLGGGLFGAGPGGCRSPEECKALCEDPDQKQKCEGFFQRFQGAPRGFEQSQEGGPQQGGEEFEAQRKAVEGQMLRQMKEGMRQMTRMVSEMERRIKSLERRKVVIPEEITSAMAALKELVVKAQNITDPSEMGEIGPQIGELVGQINESFGDLERLAEAPRVLAQANRMIRQFDSQFKRLEARARGRKVDVTEAISAAKAILDEVKAARDAAATAIAQGDADAAFEQLQTGVFERGDDLGEKIFALEVIVQAPQKIAQKGRELRAMERRIKQLGRKGEDVAEAKELFAQAKVRFDDIKALVRQRPLPTEEIMAQIEEFEDMLDQIRSAIGEEENPAFHPLELELPEGIPIAPTSGTEIKEGATLPTATQLPATP